MRFTSMSLILLAAIQEVFAFITNCNRKVKSILDSWSKQLLFPVLAGPRFCLILTSKTDMLQVEGRND